MKEGRHGGGRGAQLSVAPFGRDWLNLTLHTRAAAVQFCVVQSPGAEGNVLSHF